MSAASSIARLASGRTFELVDFVGFTVYGAEDHCVFWAGDGSGIHEALSIEDALEFIKSINTNLVGQQPITSCINELKLTVRPCRDGKRVFVTGYQKILGVYVPYGASPIRIDVFRDKLLALRAELENRPSKAGQRAG